MYITLIARVMVKIPSTAIMGRFQKSQVFLAIFGAILKIILGLMHLGLSGINCISPVIKSADKY